MVRENEGEDDPAEDPVDDTINDESSKNSEYIPTDVNMVFALPAEFRAPEA